MGATDPSAESRSTRVPWLLLAAVVALFVDLGAYHFLSPDEGRYAESAREMLELGDWLAPQYAYVERLNKPPLLYWLTAVSFRVFGLHEWAGRLVSVLAALLGGLAVYRYGRSSGGRDLGVAAVVVLLTSFWYAALSRTLVTDMLLCAFLTAAIVAFHRALQTQSRRDYLLFFAAAAGATLTKGPIGLVLPALIGGIFLTVQRAWGRVSWAKVGGGVVLYVALATPWFLLVEHRYPGFLRYLLLSENLGRFGGKYHEEPFYFYIPVLLAGALPWSLSLFPALAREWRLFRAGDEDARFRWIWFLTIFAFFSASRAKLPSYVLPCFPPLALIIAGAWTAEPEDAATGPGAARWQRGVTGALVAMLLGGLGVATLAPRLLSKFSPGAAAEVGWCVGIAAALGLAVCGAALLFRADRRVLFAATALSGVFLMMATVQSARRLFAPVDMFVPALQVARAARSEDAIVAYDAPTMTAFRFYLGREWGSSRRLEELPPSVLPGTLAEGEEEPPRRARQKRQEAERTLRALLRGPRRTYCLIRTNSLRRLSGRAGFPSYEVLGESLQHTLIRGSDSNPERRTSSTSREAAKARRPGKG